MPQERYLSGGGAGAPADYQTALDLIGAGTVPVRPMITHRLSLIRRADRVLVLRGGRLVDQGRHEELLGRSADYQRIFGR